MSIGNLETEGDVQRFFERLNGNALKAQQSLVKRAAVAARTDVDATWVNGIGPVLTSPNGTRYRLVVSNAGVLTTVAV